LKVHRTTFIRQAANRQAANLSHLKEYLWQQRIPLAALAPRHASSTRVGSH
jgi:hypothetical protein